MSARHGVLCFGEVLIDMLSQPPATPDAPRAFLQFAGGAPANVAVAVARLGGEGRFAGMLGKDMFGDFLLQSLIDAGVDTRSVVRTDAAKTALAFVALDDEGERSFSFYRPPAADLLFRKEHFAADCFDGVGAFHVCSNSMTEPEIAQATLDGMRLAREAGAIVSMDLNLRPMLWAADVDPAPRLWQALALADVVKLAREELEFLAGTLGSDGDAVISHLWEGHATLVLVTDGSRPLQWLTREARGELQPFRVQIQDSTGAGDAFVGGLLHGLVRQVGEAGDLSRLCRDIDTMTEILRFAAAVGALAVTRKGAFAAMPSHDDVLSLIREQP